MENRQSNLLLENRMNQEIERLREVIKNAAENLRAQCVGLRVVADLERALETPPAHSEVSPANDEMRDRPDSATPQTHSTSKPK
jgi:hypothetical protein